MESLVFYNFDLRAVNSYKMVKKCCIPGCRGNYDAKNKVRVYRLPSNEEERSRWINSIPRSNFPNKPDTVVCERHFPEKSSCQWER